MDEEKYIYEFADGELSGINISEIPPEVLAFLEEDDRRVRRNNNRETRRHIHWEQMNNGFDSVLVPDGTETAPEIYHREMLEKLETARESLTDNQNLLIDKIFGENRTQRSVAAEEGVLETAICNRMNRIYKKIEKKFDLDREVLPSKCMVSERTKHKAESNRLSDRI